jgi:hypothetical protein
MDRKKGPGYEDRVFVNCPFDEEYEELFDAIVFAVHDSGFVARCALEASDSGEARIDKILAIIAKCKFGIHGISRTELSKNTKLPRFNMPLVLGLFLGAKTFGRRGPRAKVCLILDRQKYRYQKFCSEIFFNRMIQGGYLLLQLLACPNASDTPSAPPKDLARSGIDS